MIPITAPSFNSNAMPGWTGRLALHRAGQADAERHLRELQRTHARRAFEPDAVPRPLSYETWVLKFGPAFARNLRRLRPAEAKSACRHSARRRQELRKCPAG